MTPLIALAQTLHATAPHGQLYPFEECPQRDHDEREAEEIIAGLVKRGFTIAPSRRSA